MMISKGMAQAVVFWGYAAAGTTPSASIATSEEDATAISGRYLDEIIVVERTKPGEEEQEWSLNKS
jgi:hypothetical protein